MDQNRRWVHLLDVPVEPLLGAHLWLAGVFQELRGVTEELSQGAAVAPRLQDLAVMLEHALRRQRAFLVEQLEAAANQGEGVTDLWLDLRPDSVNEIVRFVVICDEIRECCEAGLLETPAPGDVAEWLLRWVARELIGQLELGRPPRSYVQPPWLATTRPPAAVR
jgi:hypothetical protein